MKNIFLVLVAVFTMSACGNPVNVSDDMSKACQGTGPLLITSVTPTNITFTSGQAITLNESVKMLGTRCQVTTATIAINNFTVSFYGSTVADTETFILNGMAIDTSLFTGSTGTWSLIISTPTATSTPFIGQWTRQ